MSLDICAVFDSAVGAYNRPLFFRSRAEAIRSFQDACANSENGFSAHAEHYSFWRLGTFDETTGVLTHLHEPDRLCGALDFVVPTK